MRDTLKVLIGIDFGAADAGGADEPMEASPQPKKAATPPPEPMEEEAPADNVKKVCFVLNCIQGCNLFTFGAFFFLISLFSKTFY